MSNYTPNQTVEMLNRLQRWMLDKLSGMYTETLIWTNNNPGADFVAQTISIPDLAEYDKLKVVYKLSKANSNEMVAEFESNALLQPAIVLEKGYTYIINRQVQCVTGGIKFGDSILKSTTASDPNAGVYNHNAIPLKIYGLKKVSGGGALLNRLFAPLMRLDRGCVA